MFKVFFKGIFKGTLPFLWVQGYRDYVEIGLDEEIKHVYSKGKITTIFGDNAF